MRLLLFLFVLSVSVRANDDRCRGQWMASAWTEEARGVREAYRCVAKGMLGRENITECVNNALYGRICTREEFIQKRVVMVLERALEKSRAIVAMFERGYLSD